MKTFKKIHVCLVAFGLVICGFASAQTQSREIKKDFQINKGDLLEIENKFGDIDVQSWDKPELSISVKLSADAKSDASAKSIIDKMSVEIKQENNTITARTVFNNESGMSQGNRFAINYTVYVPKWMNLNLVNKFGNIHIDEISGLVNIDLKHGDLRIMSLLRDNEKPYNQIVMAFSNGIIDHAGSLNLILSFSKLEVEEADIFVVETKYSGINAIICNSFTCESKYDNFKLNEVRNLSGMLQYSNLRVGKFSGNLELESTYTGVKLDQVLPSFESMKITNVRGSYKIGVHPETSFDFNGTSSRGEINLEGFDILEKKTDGNTKTIRAVGGTEGTGKFINVSVEAGSVSLFKN